MYTTEDLFDSLFELEKIIEKKSANSLNQKITDFFVCPVYIINMLFVLMC